MKVTTTTVPTTVEPTIPVDITTQPDDFVPTTPEPGKYIKSYKYD